MITIALHYLNFVAVMCEILDNFLVPLVFFFIGTVPFPQKKYHAPKQSPRIYSIQPEINITLIYKGWCTVIV